MTTHTPTARAWQRTAPIGLGVAAALLGGAAALEGGDATPAKAQFADPVRMAAAGTPIEVEAPGYASPAWHDVNGDGRADLVVGQFAGGKMSVFHGQEDGSLGEHQWLMAGGEVAEVPGVW